MKRQSREISSNSTEATSSSLQDTLPRPIFRFESDSRQRVYNCTCKWVYDWHRRLNFPCHQATVYSRHFKRQYSTPSNLKLLHLGEVENGEPKNIEKTDEHYKEETNNERESSDSTNSEQIDTEEKEPIHCVTLQGGLEGDEELSNEKIEVNIDISTKPEDETGDQGKMETSPESTPEIFPLPPPVHTEEESKSLSGGIDSDQRPTEENEKDERDEESGEMPENAKEKDEVNEENENLSKTLTPSEDFKNKERLPRPFHVFEIEGDISRESYENELLGKVVRVVGTGYYCGTVKIKSPIGGMVKQTQEKKESSDLEETAVKSPCGLIENETNRTETESLSQTENNSGDEQETSYKSEMIAIDMEGKHVDNTEGRSEDNGGVFNDHPNGGKGIVERVYWDNGVEELECDREKLLLFDIDETHEDIECDGCKENPLRGIRWHCVSCPYINLCTKCYMADKHNRDHIFRRIMTPGSKGPVMPKRSNSEENGKRKEMCRITKDCDVIAVTTDMKGKVLKFWKGKVCWYELDGKSYPFQVDTEEELIANDTMLNIHHMPSLTADMVRNIPGIRVMMELATKENREKETYIVGTLVKYKDYDGKLELHIKWDGSDNNNPEEEQYCVPGEEGPLKLFDAGIVSNTNGKLTDTEMEPKETRVKLFEENILIKQRQGNCLWPYQGMCKGSSESIERAGTFQKRELLIPVQVQSADGYIYLMDICDLKIKREDERDKANQFYYQDHLQNLGQDGTEYIEAKIRHGEKMDVTEIQIHLWHGDASTSWETSFNPSLFFILMDDKEEYLGDIISFSRNSSVPCYLACQKILLWNNDQDIGTSCGVHHSTTKQTIEKLLENGCTIFKIMSGKKEADLKYFMDMAKRYLGEEVIPVILKSKENFKLDETTLEEAKTEIIPIVSAKISDFTWVAWPSNETLSDDRKKNKSLSKNKIKAMPKKQDDRQDIDESNIETYIVNTSRPWEVKQWNEKNLSKDNLEYEQWFFKTKEVNLDNIIPLILVGVAMHIFHVRKVTGLHVKLENSGAMMKMLQYVKYLSCLLLKRGQWIFPGQFVRMTMEEIFDQTSLHYIFGRNMEEDISKKLWKDLRREMKSTSFPPEIKDGKLKLRNEYSGVNLVFYALLKTKNFVGARQLVEKGCIGIRPILIGTRTLDDLKKEWRATIDFQKEMESLAGTLNQHALSIINYIQEKDERNRHIASEWRIKNLATNTIQISFQEWRSKLKQFFFNEDEKSDKVGRLLLNHGYLETAYKTENECFLENAKLKTMLKEMWYGEGYKEKKCCDKISYIVLRLFLCIIHIFVIPVMVFSLGLPSWLYQKYHVPILKLWINMAGLVSFLVAFAYMLLFDFTENGISQSEYAVLYWITNKFLDELHQVFVIRCRKSKRKTRRDRYCEYIKNIWNWLDWFIIIFCFVGSAAKYFTESESVQGFAKIMLLLSFILLNMRILNMFWTYEFLGTRLVIIQKMAGITFAFMAIMLVIMMCYNVVDYALLYPNTEFTWTEIQNIAKNGYWALYGNFPDDDYSNCTNNATEYEQELRQRCPTSLGEALSPYLRAIYGFVAIVMLLNLLIAIYTKAYERVDSKSRLYWSQQQSEFLEEYTIRTIFPVHMKGLCLLVFVIYSLVFLILGKIKKTVHENQRLMRVLFFDETFDDLRTESTEVEIDGMLEVQRDTNTLKSEAEDISVKQERVGEQENTDVKTSIKDLNEKIQFLLTELNTIKSLSAPKGIYTSLKEDH